MIQVILPALYRMASLPFRFYVGLLAVVLLLGSVAFWGSYSSEMTTIMGIYVMIWLISYTILYAKKQGGQSPASAQASSAEPTRQSLPMFLVFFVGSLMVFSLLFTFLRAVMVQSSLEASFGIALAGGLLTGFAKAFIEEDVFRGQLMPILGNFGQAVLFGLFHGFVLYYGAGLTEPLALIASIAWLAGLGYLWGVVRVNFGLGAAVGSHFGYNMVAIGTAALIFGMTAAGLGLSMTGVFIVCATIAIQKYKAGKAA